MPVKTPLFMKNFDGVHVMSPLSYEFAVCGDAFDLYADGSSVKGYMKESGDQIVTCTRCSDVVSMCKKVRVRQ